MLYNHYENFTEGLQEEGSSDETLGQPYVTTPSIQMSMPPMQSSMELSAPPIDSSMLSVPTSTPYQVPTHSPSAFSLSDTFNKLISYF